MDVVDLRILSEDHPSMIVSDSTGRSTREDSELTGSSCDSLGGHQDTAPGSPLHPQTNHHWVFVTVVTRFGVSVALFIDRGDNDNRVLLIPRYFRSFDGDAPSYSASQYEGAGWLASC